MQQAEVATARRKRIGFSLLVLMLLGLFALGCQPRVQPAPMAPPPEPTTTYEYPTQYVTAHRLNVRTGPSTKYTIIAVLKRGEAVQIMERVNDWLKVRRPPHLQMGGFGVGWVYGGYITGYEIEIKNRPRIIQGQPWG